MSSSEKCHEGIAVNVFDGGQVIDCKTCGFKHVMPLPTVEALKEFYEIEFYQSEKPTYLEASAEDSEWKNVEFTRRFATAEKYFSSTSPKKRVLDIGCGPGDFLEVGKSRGWNGTGVEPSPVAAKYAASRGLTVIVGFFDNRLAATLGHFNFIHMSEVLEHIPNPIELLQSAFNILEPGGILCVSVPNDFSPVQKVLIEEKLYEPWWVVPDHHLNYFNFETLANTIAGAGFDLLEKTTNFPMELFLLMGQDYTNNDGLGRELHGWRKVLDITLAQGDPDLHSRFYNALADADMGRLAVQFAQKPL